MPIIDLQRRVAEVGRIRLGEQAEYKDSRTGELKTRPRALGRFRFTSPKEALIQQLAEAYGGEVRNWQAQSGPQFEVITEAKEIDVVLIPAEIGFTQWLELWDATGCLRRCDGLTEVRGDAPQPCICERESNRICRETTRLSVLLPVSPDFGTWRLETNSYYAAGEMRTAIELALGIAARRGDHFAYGSLRVEDRVTRRPGEKPHRFPVPVLDVRLDRAALQPPQGAPGQLVQPQAAKPLEVNTAAVEAATALTAVEYPTPQPRIERGAVSGSPHPLADLGAVAPSAPPPAPVASSPLLAAEAQEAGVAEDQVAFQKAQTKPPVDERTRTMRRVFATIKDLWPDLEPTDREERRHAIAILETVNRRGEIVPSFSELTADELAHVEARLQDIRLNRIQMKPIPNGYVFISQSGRSARITRDDTGHWSYSVHDAEPTQGEVI